MVSRLPYQWHNYKIVSYFKNLRITSALSAVYKYQKLLYRMIVVVHTSRFIQYLELTIYIICSLRSALFSVKCIDLITCCRLL